MFFPSLEYWYPGKKAVARIYAAVSISDPSPKGNLTWEKTVGAQELETYLNLCPTEQLVIHQNSHFPMKLLKSQVF